MNNYIKQHKERATLRLLKLHFDAKVGHLGGNLSCLDVLLLLFHEYLNQNTRFILSKGHSAGSLYIALWSLGKLSEADLCTFHANSTRLPGHPPAKQIPEIAFATGSLGHGLSLAAGTALALKLKNDSGQVYCLCSDGEWQEGSTWEALIFSRHNKLDNLTIIIDHNGLQGFGSTKEVASMDSLWDKLVGFGCQLSVVNGHDVDEMRFALNEPILASSAPRVIILKTVKGRGLSFFENKMESHYLPLSPEQYQLALSEINAQFTEGGK